MSAQFAKDQVSFQTSTKLSSAMPAVYAPSSEGGVIAMVRQGAERIRRAFERRAVMNELSRLTDRELADIGLNRSDIGGVFDAAVITNRITPRA